MARNLSYAIAVMVRNDAEAGRAKLKDTLCKWTDRRFQNRSNLPGDMTAVITPFVDCGTNPTARSGVNYDFNRKMKNMGEVAVQWS